MTGFNLIDLLLLVVVLLSLVAGIRRGFLSTTAELVCFVVGVVAAVLGTQPLANYLQELGWVHDPWAAPLSFLVLLLVVRALLDIVIGRLMAGVPKRVHQNPVNRVLGIVPGFANGALNAIVLAMLLLSLPLSDTVTKHAQASLLTQRLVAPAEWVEAQLGPIFSGALDRTLNKLSIEPESTHSIPLNFTVKDAKPRPDLEEQMLELLNAERLKQGLNALKADPEATAVARAHARDMFARGYFSHVTPEGKSPFDRMNTASVRFLAAGENLALARTVPMAHDGLMASPGHRANILKPSFGRVGIGVLDGGRHGLIVTEVFRN